MDIEAALGAAFAEAEIYRGHGTVTSYIPSLSRIDPRKLGAALALPDGRVLTVGDADEALSLQSISYVFGLALALKAVGPALWNRVGKEPAGSPINSIVQLEWEKGKPRNPLINAGAMVACDAFIADRGADEAIGELLGFVRELSGDGGIAVDENVAMSESKAGAYNRSLAQFISAYANLTNPVEEVLRLYFAQCAVGMSCRQLARAALHLAFDGTDPITGDAVMIPARSRRINAMMLTCGHYDNTGEFASKIGLPGKSGLSGGILAVAPGHGAIAVWSPGLNAFGTSLAGAVLLEKLIERTGWSIFV